MKLLKKSAQIALFLGILLGITPKAQAIEFSKIIGTSALALSLTAYFFYSTSSEQKSIKNETSDSNKHTAYNTPTIIYEKFSEDKLLQISCRKVYESPDERGYKIYVKDLDERWNFVRFTVHKDFKAGYLNTLSIEPEMRRKNYGALLYACAIKIMLDFGCTEIVWSATPIHLLPGQSGAQMLPKLINFYQQLGAYPESIEPGSARIRLNNIKKARQGIYKILEQWESKSPIQVNTQALKRAAIMVNHLTAN